MAAYKLCKNLVPVGNECSFASETEAAYFFAQRGLFGNINLVLAINAESDNDDDDIYAWMLTDPKGKVLGIVSIFATTVSKINNISYYDKIARGEIFKYKHNSYQVTWNKLLGITIRKISDFYHQTDIENVILQMGYKNLTFYLCKLHPVIEPQKLIAYCWKIYASGENPEDITAIFYYPLFKSDAEKIYQWDINDVNTISIDIGDVIPTPEQYWQLCKDENDKLFIKPLFKLIKKASQ